MLKIYGFPMSSRANKVLMCANKLDLEYEYLPLNIPGGEHKTPEYLEINPVGKVPAIVDGDFSLFESNSILKYLCEKHDSDLYPKDLQSRSLVDQWCDFICQHLGIQISRVAYNKLFAEKMGDEKDERAMAEGYRFINKFLSVVEGQLNKTKYLAGDKLSLADLTLLAEIDPCEMIEVDLKKYPKVHALVQQLRSEDFYRNVHKFYGESLAKV